MLDKVYAPKDVEGKIYAEWLANGCFHAEPRRDKTPFTIVIPPPNITGQLHMGHALDNTIQDILIRWRRMQGYCALWMPGTDHASIATEVKIVEALEAEGLTKDGIGREAFLQRAWEWKNLYGGRIVEQLKRLGCSCDWERERFTMDEGLSAAVTSVFVRLYEDGLIYKGERIINWCPGCRTSISDVEVEYREREGDFWYIKYPVYGADGEYITVATTRPETMLGDTAVAVNPDDPRYALRVGQRALLPLTDRLIPVIADRHVDSALGSGALKVTPAHDPNDFEIGLRHGLEPIRVFDDAAVMNENAGVYKGLDRDAARRKIVGDLDALGLIEKIEPHAMNVGECSRCGSIIEPVVSSQWFVKMKPLAEPAIEAVKDGHTQFIPDRFSKIYYNWMESIQDWCISRQLWWGHRIPAYFCVACGETTVSATAPAACPKCGGALKRDEDVLDTWFSSALWPFSTLGWPEKTAEMEYFYPTDVLVTGYDIIFFWVARMIFSGIRHTGKAPFKYAYIHGMVRDEQGRKMSKSLGNGIDPLEVVDKYGADALRFALIIGAAPGNDLRFSEDKVISARNFANKLWNAARFVLARLEAAPDGLTASEAGFSAADRWIIMKLNGHVGEVNENLEKFELGIALQKIYDFIWDVYCDWYIEFAKPVLSAGGGGTLTVLRYVLIQNLKLLHPFMPFITEEIYAGLSRVRGIRGTDALTAMMAEAGKNARIMTDAWPRSDESPARLCAPGGPDGALWSDSLYNTSQIIEVIRAIRNMRAEKAVPPSRKIKCVFVTADQKTAAALEEGRIYIERLAALRPFIIADSKDGLSLSDVTLVAGGAEALFPLGDLVDAPAEIRRLEKELANLDGEIKRASAKLSNPGFTGKAPAGIIEDERRKLAAYEEARGKVTDNIIRLQRYAK